MLHPCWGMLWEAQKLKHCDAQVKVRYVLVILCVGYFELPKNLSLCCCCYIFKTFDIWNGYVSEGVQGRKLAFFLMCRGLSWVCKSDFLSVIKDYKKKLLHINLILNQLDDLYIFRSSQYCFGIKNVFDFPRKRIEFLTLWNS